MAIMGDCVWDAETKSEKKVQLRSLLSVTPGHTATVKQGVIKVKMRVFTARHWFVFTRRKFAEMWQNTLIPYLEFFWQILL